MTLLRLLFLLAALYLAWRFLYALWAKSQAPSAETPYLPMSACAKCGAHVPQETLSKKGLCGRCAEPAT